MGLILLCNLAVSADRVDIVPNFETVRRESVHTIFSTISFGLSYQVALNKRGTQRSSKLSSLISLDPYPHHILASLQLAADVLLIYLKRDEIAQDAFDSFCRIALDELPQSLQSVQRAKKLLYDKLVKSIHPLDTGLNLSREPAVDDLSIPRGQQRQQAIRDEYRISNGDATSGELGGGLVSFSSLHLSDVDESGHSCLAKTLFSKPAVVLSTSSSVAVRP